MLVIVRSTKAGPHRFVCVVWHRPGVLEHLRLASLTLYYGLEIMGQELL